MRLIRLEILNLASLDNPNGETIDFEEGVLGSSNIFSIVGPTGSGKSTLLDAICLALYNRAPRYPRKKGEKKKIEVYGQDDDTQRLAPTDCRNILTKGKKEGYSKLTFCANNGSVYRAEWHVRMKVKAFDENKTYLYRLSTADGRLTEEQATWEELPQIIGLEYEQFLRTVVIAQGSFANFLTAKEDERYELLEKLVGCEEMYVRIATEIKRQRDEAQEAYNAIAADFKAIEKDLIKEPEALQTLAEEIQTLEAMEQQVKGQLLKVNEALAWYAKEAEHLKNIERFGQQLRLATEALEAIRQDCEQLRLYDATREAVTRYKAMEDCRREAEKMRSSKAMLERQAQQQQTDVRQAETLLEERRKTATQAHETLEQQKPHINRARTLKAELKAVMLSLTEKGQLRKDCEKAEQKASNDLNSNLAAIAKVQKPELEGQTAERLQQAKENAIQTRNDLREALRVRQELESALQKQTAETAELEKLQTRSQEIAAQLEQLSIDALTAEVRTLTNSLTLLKSRNLSQCRQELEDGKPCPVCGATVHPYHDEAVLTPVVNELSQLKAEKEALLTVQTQTLQKLTQEQGETNGRLRELNNHLVQLSSTLAGLQGQWGDLTARHPDWPSDVASLQALATPANEAMERATQWLNDFIILEAERSKTDNLKRQQAEKAEALRAAASALLKIQEEAKAQAAALQEEIGEQDPDLLEQTLTEAQTQADNAVTSQTTLLSRKREELQGTHGKLSATAEALANKLKEQEQHSLALDVWLTDYNALHNEATLSRETIAAVLASDCRWEDVRQQQRVRTERCTSALTTLENEKNAHQQHQALRPADCQEALEQQKRELENHSNAALVEAKARKQRHDDATKLMGNIQDELTAKSLKATEWDEISRAIGSDGKTLRKIAQCYTLRFLVEHANEEIRKFNSRYELQQVKNSLGMRVIDHDRADVVRETTSLSGGETFIVSLGLALGLSALSSRNISFENLFIDEGFGTLDPDTLATVIDSLAMLQTSQGKKVGVISHTDTMSERITTQIRIIKNGNGSSYIKVYPE